MCREIATLRKDSDKHKIPERPPCPSLPSMPPSLCSYLNAENRYSKSRNFAHFSESAVDESPTICNRQHHDDDDNFGYILRGVAQEV